MRTFHLELSADLVFADKRLEREYRLHHAATQVNSFRHYSVSLRHSLLT
jgi:hypothetical protein